MPDKALVERAQYECLCGARLSGKCLYCELKDTITQQAERIAALEQDARRYRWIKANEHPGKPFHFTGIGLVMAYELDAAIDAQLSEKPL